MFVFYRRFLCRALSVGPLHETMEFCVTSSLELDKLKLLAISQTLHTVCCKDDYFPKGKFKLFKLLLNLYLIVCFTQCTLFFQKVCFLLPICLPCVVCSEDNCCVATQRAADIRVAWLVYVRMYCVRMASLN